MDIIRLELDGPAEDCRALIITLFYFIFFFFLPFLFYFFPSPDPFYHFRQARGSSLM